MSFASLLSAMTAAACRGEGGAVAACFTPDGVYHDCFYGAFAGADIARMVEDYFHRDARDFRWDLHDVVDNGSLGYARYVFSYESTLPGCEGQRALFEGVAICELTAADVVRHPLVQRLVTAYANRDAHRLAATGQKRFHGQQQRRLDP